MKQDSWLKIQTAAMAALALFCSVGVVMSQRPDGARRMDPAQMVERQVTDMKERLKLTSDQEAKIKPIVEESMKTMMAMRENREDTAKKISAVLTEEQQAEYKKMMSERRGFGGPGGRKGPPKQ